MSENKEGQRESVKGIRAATAGSERRDKREMGPSLAYKMNGLFPWTNQ